MKETLKRIENKIEAVQANLTELNITVAKQEVTLTDHVRRTEILENEIKPLKKERYRTEGAVKLIGLCALLLGVVRGVMWAFGN